MGIKEAIVNIMEVGFIVLLGLLLAGVLSIGIKLIERWVK